MGEISEGGWLDRVWGKICLLETVLRRVVFFICFGMCVCVCVKCKDNFAILG